MITKEQAKEILVLAARHSLERGRVVESRTIWGDYSVDELTEAWEKLKSYVEGLGSDAVTN